jgi:YVTN family beta-propeller protein
MIVELVALTFIAITTLFIIGIEAQTQVTIEIGPTQPFKIAYDPLTKNMYVANFKGTVSVINTTSNHVVGTIPVGGQLADIEYDPVNNRMYVTSQATDTQSNGTVSVIDTTTNAIVGNPIPVDNPNGIAFDSANNRMYVTNFEDTNLEGTVSVINTTAINLVGSPIPVQKGAIDIAYDPVIKNMYVTSILDDTGVSVINTTTNTVLGNPIPVQKGATDIAYDPVNMRM